MTTGRINQMLGVVWFKGTPLMTSIWYPTIVRLFTWFRYHITACWERHTPGLNSVGRENLRRTPLHCMLTPSWAPQHIRTSVTDKTRRAGEISRHGEHHKSSAPLAPTTDTVSMPRTLLSTTKQGQNRVYNPRLDSVTDPGSTQSGSICIKLSPTHLPTLSSSQSKLRQQIWIHVRQKL